MTGFIARRGAELEWQERRHMEIDGKRQPMVLTKLYLDPTTDPALLRVLEYAPGYIEPRHRHTVDEIVYIIAGDVQVGDERYQAGDALWIAAGTEYGPLKTGSAGMTFLIVRNSPSDYVATAG